MKSKMKSAFALIAVALMIMVAVVPMVGLLTSDSDATTITDPVIKETDKITIQGKIYNNGTQIVSVTGLYVRIVWGGGLYSIDTAVTTGTNSYSVTLNEKTISQATMTVLKTVAGEKVVDDTYDSVTLSSLVGGKTYTADIKAGSGTSGAVTVNIRIAANSTVDVKGTSAFSAAKEIYVLYELYGGADRASATRLSYDNKLVIKENNANVDTPTVAYPLSSTWTGIKVTKLFVDGVGCDVSSQLPSATISTSTYSVDLDDFLMIINSSAKIPKATLTVSSEGVTFYNFNVTTIGGGLATNKAYFVYKNQTEAGGVITYTPLTTVTASVAFGSAFTLTAEIALTNNVGTYTPSSTATYYGDVQMGTSGVFAYDGQALTIMDKESETATSGTPIATYVHEGFYIANGQVEVGHVITVALGDFELTSINGKTLTNGSYTNASGNTVPSTYTTGIVVKADSFTKVTITSPKEVTATLTTASPVFGVPFTPTSGIITIPATGLSFMATKGATVSIMPSDYASVTYTSGVGDYVVGSTAVTIALTIEDKKIQFGFVDGDGNPITSTTVKAYYKLPGATTYSSTANTASGSTAEVAVAGYIDLTQIKVYFVDDAVAAANVYKYSFQNSTKETAIDYAPVKNKMTVTSLDKTYYVGLQDSNGNAITLATGDSLNVSLRKAYINESGSNVFEDYSTYVASLGDITASKTYPIMVSSAFVGKTLTTSAQYVLIVMPSVTGYIYSTTTPTIVTGDMTVKASVDSIKGTLYKHDGVTPIAGAVATLKSSSAATTAVGIASTDEDGVFEITSTTKIGSGYVMTFSLAGFEFKEGGNDYYSAYNATTKAKVTEYSASKDYYAFMIEDADEADYDVVTGDVLTFKSAATAVPLFDMFTATLALDVGDVYTPILTDGTNMKRSFAQYTVTEDDVSTGIITLTTLESTYAVTATDAEGNPLYLSDGTTPATTTLYLKTGESYDEITLTNTATKFVGLRTVSTDYTTINYILPELPGSADGYYVVMSAYNEYSFPTAKALLDIEGTVIESTSQIFLIPLMDAAGNVLTIDSTTAPTAVGLTITVQDGMMRFVGVGSTKYTFELKDVLITDGTGAASVDIRAKYFPNTGENKAEYKLKPNAGALVSANQMFTFKVVDAALDMIPGTYYDVNVYGYLSETNKVKLNTAALTVLGGVLLTVGPADDYLAFTIESAGYTAVGYTFDAIEGNIFIANEQTVEAVFSAINGSVDGPDAYTFTAYGLDGSVLDSEDNEGIVVDVDKVAYYELSVDDLATVDPYFPKDLEITSLTNVFVSPLTKVTGSLPVAAVADDYVMIEQYLGEQVVFTDKVDLAAGAKTYTIYVDVSGMVDETAGVAFDSIFATYVHDGAVYASVPVDPTAVFNPIVTPGSAVIQYVAVLVPPSAVIADHVDYAQVGNTVTVTADANFFVADDESIYTDGQYKYVFAGWYVDNEKVSANPVFTFTMTEDVVISPQYTVTYEKTSDVNKDVEKEYVNIVEKVEVPVEKTVGIDTNVLIIGICAVIVALIAVVYAVIKKE